MFHGARVRSAYLASRSMAFPERRQEQIPALWRIHPQPHEGESMESWIIRQAHANFLSPTTFAARYLDKPWRDFDFLVESDPEFGVLARCIAEGGDRASQMTFLSFRRTSGMNKKGLLSWTSPASDARRYCPLCLSTKSPFLRLIWRLTFAPICHDHNVLLRSTCGNVECQAEFHPWRMNPIHEIVKCGRCGSSLSNAPTDEVETIEPAYAASSSLLALLKGARTLEDIGWESDVTELFRTLEFLITCQRMVRRAKHKSNDSPDRHGLELGLRGAPHLAYELLGEAWLLLQDWPERIQPFIRANQRVLNPIIWRLTHNIVRWKPSSDVEGARVSPLAQLVHNLGLRTQEAKYRSSGQRVLRLLAQTGNPLSPTEIADRLSLNRHTIRRKLQELLTKGLVVRRQHSYALRRPCSLIAFADLNRVASTT